MAAFSTQTAEEIIREYLLFRGFVATTRSLEAELKSDRDKGLSVENLVQQIFNFIAGFDLDGLLFFWDQLSRRFFSRTEASFSASAKKLETSLKRYYLVHCIESMRQDKVTQFFETMATEIHVPEWQEWWILPFIKNPETHPNFESYFAKSWLESLHISLFNFLSSVLHSISLPFLLEIQKEKGKYTAPAMVSRPSSILTVPEITETRITPLKLPVDETETKLDHQDTRGPAAPATPGQPPTSAPLASESIAEDVSADETERPPFETGESGVYREHEAAVQRVLLSPSGFFAASLDINNTLHVWSCSPSRIVPRHRMAYPAEDSVTCFAWMGPEEHTLAVAHRSAQITLLETHGLKPADTMQLANMRDIRAIACSPAGWQLLACAVTDSLEGRGLVVFVDATTRTVARSTVVAADAVAQSLRFNHDGRLLVAGLSDGRVAVVDPGQCAVLQCWAAHHSPILDVKFSPGDGSVVSLGSDGLLLRTPLAPPQRALLLLDMVLDRSTTLAPGLHRLCTDQADEYVLLFHQSSGVPGSTGAGRLEIHRLRRGERTGCDVFGAVDGLTQVAALDWCVASGVCVCATADGLVHSYSINSTDTS